MNGLIGQNGHQELADGTLGVTTNKGTVPNFAPDAFDGIGDPAVTSYLCGSFNLLFCGVTFITFTPETFQGFGAFQGYIEGVTVAVVPLPASVGFLAAGLAGLGIMARKRRRG